MHTTRKKHSNRVSNNRPYKGRKKKPARKPGIDVHKYIQKQAKTTPPAPYTPEHTFADLGLHPKLTRQIEQRGYTAPTEIQDKAIQPVMTGRDLIGIAGTGTGKTAAFLIPIIDRLLETPQDQYALIITPTRELASQISDEFAKLTEGMKLFSTSLIGGIPIHQSIKALRRTNHVVIGTPGRLIDLEQRGVLSMDNFQVLVLDEFDRMLDMGFVNDVKGLNEKMTRKEQTLLFSATVDPSMRPIVEGITDQAQEVKAGKGSVPRTHTIEQDVIRVNGRPKMDVLHELILESSGEKVILFCETKRMVDKVHQKLKRARVRTEMIHGDKTQRAREHALRKFKRGTAHVLVATDVVARGIDVDDVSLVINYEAPRDYNDYIHRIGRTGRAGKTGKAITLID